MDTSTVPSVTERTSCSVELVLYSSSSEPEILSFSPPQPTEKPVAIRPGNKYRLKVIASFLF